MQRQANFAQSTTLCFQYLGFHDHNANMANYVISPGLHGQAFHGPAFHGQAFHGPAFHGQAQNFVYPGFHDKQQNSSHTMPCNVVRSMKTFNSKQTKNRADILKIYFSFKMTQESQKFLRFSSLFSRSVENFVNQNLEFFNQHLNILSS